MLKNSYNTLLYSTSGGHKIRGVCLLASSKNSSQFAATSLNFLRFFCELSSISFRTTHYASTVLSVTSNTIKHFGSLVALSESGNSDTLPNPSISESATIERLSLSRLNISFRWHCIYQHLSAETGLLTIDGCRPYPNSTLPTSARKTSVYCNWDSDGFIFAGWLTSCSF